MLEEGPARDAEIIASAQKCEHYEMANYGSVIAWAEEMKIDQSIIDQLEQTLDEEKEADDLLTEIGQEEVNPKAAEVVAGDRAVRARLL